MAEILNTPTAEMCKYIKKNAPEFNELFLIVCGQLRAGLRNRAACNFWSLILQIHHNSTEDDETKSTIIWSCGKVTQRLHKRYIGHKREEQTDPEGIDLATIPREIGGHSYIFSLEGIRSFIAPTDILFPPALELVNIDIHHVY